MTIERIPLTPAFFLHLQDYRESSVLATLFSQHQGLVKLIVRGGRRPHSSWRAGLQLFTPVLCSWSGSTSLKTANALEVQAPAYALKGESILGGLYLNELLVRALRMTQVHEGLFKDYQHTLEQCQDRPLAPCLRFFEKALLEAMGFAMDWRRDMHSQPFNPTVRYAFSPTVGFYAAPKGILGQALIDFDRGQLDSASAPAVKGVLQSALSFHLGPEPLASQQLIQQLYQEKEHQL